MCCSLLYMQDMQDVWHCEICNCKPGRGFEATVEVLPRLFKIKYESGTLEEVLYVDMPREYQNSSGQIVLDYAKAVEQSVFEQLQVVRDGQLRLVFSSDLKISSWEFCAQRHEELIPRQLLVPQVNQLGIAVQKYEATTQNSSSNTSVSELQNSSNVFVNSARQLAKALEVPLVNDLGYTKRYVRCLQISEVVNSMKDLIDYTRENNIGPMESLAKFPRRSNSSPGMPARTHMNSTGSPNISIQQPALSGDDSQSSVQKILHDIMLSSNPGGGSMIGTGRRGNDVKIVNGTLQTNNNSSLNGNNSLIDDGATNMNAYIGNAGFGIMGNNGLQPGLANNSMSMNGRVGVGLARNQSMNQRNQMLSGLGTMNGFNSAQFN